MIALLLILASLTAFSWLVYDIGRERGYQQGRADEAAEWRAEHFAAMDRYNEIYDQDEAR